MQRIMWLRRFAVLLALALAATACGADEPEAEPTDTAEATATDTPTDAATPDATGTEQTPGPTAAEGQLLIGTILPQTGSLAFLGPPEFAGVELAVNDINEAGGVLGNDVALSQGDSGDTTTDIANQTVDRLLAEGAQVIVGAASSGVSFTVIDKITGAGVVHFSPANTSPDFTDYDDNGLYFRTAPSDVLQGRILGQLVLDDGAQTVGLMALQDPYGEGLLENAASTIEESGGTVTDRIIYDPQAQTFDAEVQQLVSSDPDAIIVIGFDESSRILTTMIEQGIGPADKAVYGADGNMGNALGEAMETGSLEGMRGTLPGSVATEEFQERLATVDPGLIDYSYAGESYDAVVVSALAAEAAGSVDGAAIGAELVEVTVNGTECTTFEECVELVRAGEDIDYTGVSGPIDMNEAGDPTAANFQILEFDENNELFLAEEKFAEL